MPALKGLPRLAEVTRNMVLTAFGIGLAVFLVGFGVDAVLLTDARSVLYSDAVTGGLAALLAYVAIQQYQIRQQENAARLRMIAEVNHHVRNALSAILLSVHIRKDPELLKITESAVHRIDWVLTEVLSRYGKSADSAPYAEASLQESRKRDAG
jgi:signal transduction histidine kinase